MKAYTTPEIIIFELVEDMIRTSTADIGDDIYGDGNDPTGQFVN